MNAALLTLLLLPAQLPQSTLQLPPDPFVEASKAAKLKPVPVDPKELPKPKEHPLDHKNEVKEENTQYKAILALVRSGVRVRVKTNQIPGKPPGTYELWLEKGEPMMRRVEVAPPSPFSTPTSRSVPEETRQSALTTTVQFVEGWQSNLTTAAMKASTGSDRTTVTRTAFTGGGTGNLLRFCRT